MFKCLILQRLVGRNYELSVVMLKQVSLPFPPSVDISLGLWPDSKFDNDEDMVTRVMWSDSTSTFHVQLENASALSLRAIENYVKNGWEIDLKTVDRFTKKEEAIAASNDIGRGSKVIRHGDIYYVLSDIEVECLKLDGRRFEIIHSVNKETEIVDPQ